MYDYLGECSGSKYEAMQEYYYTIVEKNIDDNWQQLIRVTSITGRL
jgi:hypothetical protein